MLLPQSAQLSYFFTPYGWTIREKTQIVTRALQFTLPAVQSTAPPLHWCLRTFHGFIHELLNTAIVFVDLPQRRFATNSCERILYILRTKPQV